MSALRISLIMATIGRPDVIHRLIDSLESQTSADFELIIVDQNPAGVLENISRRLTNSKISYRHVVTDRKGLSLARNIGHQYAGNEIIGYPDDDCWYEEGVVAEVIEFFSNNPSIDGLMARWCERDLNIAAGYFLEREQWRRFRFGATGSSICLFMRRRLVEKVAGFDENLGVPHWFGAGEETDFVMRCLDAEAVIKYVPEVRVHHAINTSLSSGLGEAVRKARSRSRGTGAIYKKHRLSWFVILRGLGSPFLKSFLPPYSCRSILANIFTILGRFEGMLFWNVSPDNRKDHLSSGNRKDAWIQAVECHETQGRSSRRGQRKK